MKELHMRVNQNSDNMVRFLGQYKSKEYNKFGFDEFAKKRGKYYSEKSSIDFSDIELVNIVPNMYTEICQPFVFFNDVEKLEPAGVLNYNGVTQVGTFCFKTKDGELLIENVHSYHVFPCIDGLILPFSQTRVPEIKDLLSIYVSAIVKENDKFNIKIYHNTNLIFSEKDVYEMEYSERIDEPIYSKRYAYVCFSKKKNENTFENYLFDIRKECLYDMDDSKDVPSWGINYNKIINPFAAYLGCNNRLDDNNCNIIESGEIIHVYVHFNSTKSSAIIEHVLKKADVYEVVNNYFETDDTINVKATYIDRPEEIALLLYCAEKNPELFGCGIWGLSIEQLELGTQNAIMEIRNILNYSETSLRYYKKINKELYSLCKENIKIGQLPDKIYCNCISSKDMISYLKRYLYKYKNYRYDKKELKCRYEKIFQELCEGGSYTTKWINEMSMFKLIKKRYPDAIYQYNAQWLGLQSLDVFVPSLKIGFEYQGKQHYEAVDFFGGKENFIKQVQRDERKKRVCAENKIKLIEWRYDEPINNIVLNNKLSQ